MNNLKHTIISFFQKHLLVTMGVFVALVGVLISVIIPLLQQPMLHVTFLDVGQGDSILIQVPNGRQLLIDSGPDQSVVEQIGKSLSFFDQTIDIILATHSDADHIGGFPYVLDRYQVPLVIESEIASPTVTDRVFGEKVSQEHSARLIARSGERIILDQKRNIVVDILFPDQNPNGWETNEASIVVKVSYGDTSFLLTGDSPSEVEEHLVKLYSDQLHANVLKLGHHGSKTSSSDDFLHVVNPDIAIVSAGLGNKYGHPNPETIERVESGRAQILETAALGNIDCVSDGVTVSCTGDR
jgi:competence protein ComEC